MLTDKYGTKYSLEVGAGLKKVEDRTGNVTNFTRNGITSSNGPSVTFTRNADDVITKVTGPDGKSVQYGYDANGDLASVTDQLGKASTLHYLADHYLDRVTGPDSAVMARFEYDGGRIVAVIDGEGNRTEISADVSGRQQTVTDPGGKRTTISTYDDRGLLVRSDEVYGGQHHVTEFGYDAQRNVTYRKDPAGHEWQATYVNGNVTSLQQPSGRTTTVTYNSFGAPLVWTDAEGHATTYTWNPDGTLAGIKDALGHSETYTYTGGKQTGKVDRNGKTWAWTYTASGLLKTSKDPLGNVTTREYDANGDADRGRRRPRSPHRDDVRRGRPCPHDEERRRQGERERLRRPRSARPHDRPDRRRRRLHRRRRGVHHQGRQPRRPADHLRPRRPRP